MTTSIDHYTLLKSINKGGMGEVFLAYDSMAHREVALKQILPSLKQHAIIKARFLREAQIASQLSHPSIIPIFQIDPREDKEYYTMPYIEGDTLKQILKLCFEQEKQGEITHPLGASIPALIRLFLSLCEAVAYAHSKHIVHRDIKPDNIIVGTYGQVLLLDWGLADKIGSTQDLSSTPHLSADYEDLTRPGKVPGTLNYIAPERVLESPTHPSMDIYSLGVILYQLLTLRPPFQRGSLKEYRKRMHQEEFIEPIERARYREIPQQLNDIAKRCLHFDPLSRFQKVDQIITELKRFLEGKPEWIFVRKLDLNQKSDWAFQENMLLSPHTAITRSPEMLEWVGLSLSAEKFPGNVRLQTRIKLGTHSKGISLLIGVPANRERHHFDQGISLFLSEHSRLLSNQIEVMDLPGASIQDTQWHEVCIEKIDNQLFCYFDHKRVCHYISRTPLTGAHVGVLYYDADFELAPLEMSSSTQNAQVSCLAIPDAFLACGQYAKARFEYEQIAHSFPRRFEEREALFRSGVTLIEEAKHSLDCKETLLLQALEAFGRLRSTTGAPLEYLGKSLVYQASGELEEEIKCLELALRKYRSHPLVRLIQEQVILRLYESASSERVAAYHFALLALRHLSQILITPEHTPLVHRMRKHLEKWPLFLLTDTPNDQLGCELAFWLNKPITLVEIVETTPASQVCANALYALLMLGKTDWVEENLEYLQDKEEIELIKTGLLYFTQGITRAIEHLHTLKHSSRANHWNRCAFFLFDRALLDGQLSECLPLFSQFPSLPALDALHILACLANNDPSTARTLLDQYPQEFLHDEHSPLFTPMGCYLLCTESLAIAKAHFATSLELPYPPTSMLLGNYLVNEVDSDSIWMKQRALFWEKVMFWRHLALYFHCIHDQKQLKNCFNKIQRLIQT